ncbi:16271_t:CDS:2 [Funneliformis mosseae]|uniref:Copper transport protein n=1 Tax=Funneliformis mosseae TaxID=27381 RepID=A0A9N8WQN4_FUNMO|nr:16271_t:CDS:2 [Funneliformis mosseae]
MTDSKSSDHNMLYFTGGFQVTSIHTFVLATLFVTSLCWCERLLTYYYENSEYDKNQERIKVFATRTLGYAVLTTLRFFYMLLIMSMNSQIFIVVVTGLTTGQLIVEFIRSIPVYFTHHQILVHSPRISIKDDDLPPAILADSESLDKHYDYRDELVLQPQSFVIEHVNSNDYHGIPNNVE